VRYLVGHEGIRQIIDIGTGLPTVGNVHEVAQQIEPVFLPIESYYPDHRSFVHADLIAQAKSDIERAEAELNKKQEAYAAVERELENVNLKAGYEKLRGPADQLSLAQKTLAAAKEYLPALEARIAADRAKYAVPPDFAYETLADAARKAALGILGRPNFIVPGNTISGQPNKNGNDGTIARFGWKAQNKSLLLFSGEAYNVEMGITNELFQTERDEIQTCQFTTVPNNVTDTNAYALIEGISAIEKFAFFQRFLAPPTPSTYAPGGALSITRGRSLFNSVGCSGCHSPSLQTGNSTVEALRNQRVNLYSDLLLHDMGPRLADGVRQGQAGPREFRTAPLWGLGQRIFFLHDGRTSDLLEAIYAHQSGSLLTNNASEANEVIKNFNFLLRESQKQDILNFLRSL